MFYLKITSIDKYGTKQVDTFEFSSINERSDGMYKILASYQKTKDIITKIETY